MKRALAATLIGLSLVTTSAQAANGETTRIIGAALLGGMIGYHAGQSSNSGYYPVYGGGGPVYHPAPAPLPPVVINIPPSGGYHRHYHYRPSACGAYRVPVYDHHGRIVEYIQHCR